MDTLKYAVHPIAKLFPEMEQSELADLTADIKQNGLVENGYLYEGKVLDGRNRQIACVRAGVDFRATPWEKLPKAVTDMGPVAFVIGRNLRRRHLSSSQRAAIAAESLPMLESEAAKRRAAGLKKGAQTPSAPKGGDGTAEVAKGTAAKQAAKITGTSERQVQRAKKLKKKSPAKFERVKAGKETLGSASRDKKKEEAQRKAAIKAAKGFALNSTISDLIDKAGRGKLTLVMNDYAITVKRLKSAKPKAAKRAPAKKKAKAKAKRK